MIEFIELDRQFRELTDAELATDEIGDAESFLLRDRMGLGSSIGWAEILEYSRVVLLAEAGAGKTAEMEEQAMRLARDGQYAFFLPLESLDRDPVSDLLSNSGARRFQQWKEDAEAVAWFFLDAVDELKLTRGKLDRALRRFSNEIEDHLDRARVIVSCRPSDWRPQQDLATVRNRLLVQTKPEESATFGTAQEAFLAALSKRPAKAVHFREEEQRGSDRTGVRTVAMLPMSDRQVELFARQHGVRVAAEFLEEVDRQNSWDFARRPLDLAALIKRWNSSGDLGTRTQQHEANFAAKLQDHPERPDHDVLSDDRALEGAERIALALALTRLRTIRSPEQALECNLEEGVLRAEAALSDWTEGQRQALLRRALFDPATYGRVRFHHRSVQEYLAARRLRTLRDKGMSTRALFRLLFAERYGVEVVFPSMRAIAAWLALWDEDTRKELVGREPEVLLSFGDPGTLELQARIDLLRAFVERYGKGGRRGLRIEIEEVRRLAHPDLEIVVRKCWQEGVANTDVRELLLQLIWQGRMESCADLAEAAAFDTSGDHYGRIVAIRSLVACGRDETLRKCASSMLVERDSWPDEIVCSVAAELFPRVISVADLALLMEERLQAESSVGGFGRVMQRVGESVEPWSEPAIELRNRIAELIWRRRDQEIDPYSVLGVYSYLAPGLAVLCERQLSARTAEPLADLVWASVIASRFGARKIGAGEEIGRLRARFNARGWLRREVFWGELAFMDEIASVEEDRRRLYRAQQDGLVDHLQEEDRSWLETALSNESRVERRAVALHALIDLWHGRGKIGPELEAIRQLLKCDAELDRILAERTAIPKWNKLQEKFDEMDRKHEQRQRTDAEGEANRLERWREWREKLLHDPMEAFSGSRVQETLSVIHTWLRENSQDQNSSNCWDKEALTQAFDSAVAERVETAFRAYWRVEPTVLWSARPAAKRNSFTLDVLLGLVGVSAEASAPGWANSLSPEEARIAAAHATMEWGGFASFISDLVKSHPSGVEETIGGEASAELKIGGEHDHLSTLSNLAHSAPDLKQLFISRLVGELQAWPDAFTDETAPRWAGHLDLVLRVLKEAYREEDREAVVAECAKRYAAEPGGPLALTWLRGLFEFAPVCGAEIFTRSLGSVDSPETSGRVVQTFAALFREGGPAALEIPDLAERARVLGRLVRCAYTFIRREDDLVHKGVYSPDTRDEAQTARGFLLSRLLDTPGPEARKVVLELASEDDFAHFPDRLKLLARQRAAADAEFEPFDPAVVVVLERSLEAPARDSDELFAVMMDRLADLDHELRHGDFSDRNTVRSITEELEMQRTLAWRLREKANGVYKVAREEEVADRKKTDIRFLSFHDEKKAVAEVKISDNWSLAQLEEALRDQLLGQYLRHVDCKAGCLLLTYHGRKNYWRHPEFRNEMAFPEVVAFLGEKAKSIETETSHDVSLSVFGLNLTDPTLGTDRLVK